MLCFKLDNIYRRFWSVFDQNDRKFTSSHAEINDEITYLGEEQVEVFERFGQHEGVHSVFFLHSADILEKGRDIHIECSKQFKWNLYFYVYGQSRLFWAVLLKLL